MEKEAKSHAPRHCHSLFVRCDNIRYFTVGYTLDLPAGLFRWFICLGRYHLLLESIFLPALYLWGFERLISRSERNSPMHTLDSQHLTSFSTGNQGGHLVLALAPVYQPICDRRSEHLLSRGSAAHDIAPILATLKMFHETSDLIKCRVHRSLAQLGIVYIDRRGVAVAFSTSTPNNSSFCCASLYSSSNTQGNSSTCYKSPQRKFTT